MNIKPPGSRMDEHKTTRIQKDSPKRTTPKNYRPITCLQMIVLLAQIKNEIYDSLISRGLIPEEQK